MSKSDELSSTITSQNEEIKNLKKDISDFRLEIDRNERRPKTATSSITKSSSKNLLGSTAHSQSREREREKKESTDTTPNSKKFTYESYKSTPTQYKPDSTKKTVDTFYVTDKFKVQESTPKPVFQSFDFNDKIK